MKKKIYIVVLLFLFACKSNSPNIIQKFPEDQNLERKERAGNMFGNKEGIILFEDKRGEEEQIKEKNNRQLKNRQSTNDNLWQKTVNIISSLLPISIIEENIGLITTDWGNINSISGDNDLYKLNVVVKKESRNYSAVISAFRKKSNGIVEKSVAVEEIIRNIILND